MIITPAFLPTSPQRPEPSMARLVANYLAEFEGFSRPDSATVAYARKAEHRQLPVIERSAVEYTLSFADESGSHLRRLVNAAKNDRGQARDALPDAIGKLCVYGRSKSAVNMLLTLQMDGGPAETLSHIRMIVLTKKPALIGERLYVLSGGKASRLVIKPRLAFTGDLVFSWADSRELRDLVKPYLASSHKTIRFVGDYLSKIVRVSTTRDRTRAK